MVLKKCRDRVERKNSIRLESIELSDCVRRRENAMLTAR